jgi:hypothetical protein
MKHKIKISQYDNLNNWGTIIEIDGKELSLDGECTFNCLGEILEVLGVEADIEYEYSLEVCKTETKKMKLVEDLQ